MIAIENISKSFGRLAVLQDVSLFLEKAQCIALIGPNGCGKTTLLKTLLGMVKPQSGKIMVNGDPIASSWKYRRQIGYMPQISHYPESMTIRQLFSMMKDIRKIPENDLDMELMQIFDIPTIQDKRLGTLSGGTRQKVSACLAFLFNPDVLILDEPTAGLDPIATEALKAKIIQEKQKGKLILISSHILSELDDLVSNVIYMNEGKVLFFKPISVLFKEAGTEKLTRAIAQFMVNQEQFKQQSHE